MTSAAQYGMYTVQIATRNSSGYPTGVQTSPNSVANNTTMTPFVLDTGISFTPPSPTFSTFTERGGQQILSQASMGVSELGTATLELTAFNDALHALITSSVVDTGTPTGWRQVGYNINNVAPLDFIVMLTMKAQVRSGSSTSTKFEHWIMPNCQIRPAIPAGSQNDGVNPNPLSYSIVPSTSSRAAITGELFSATAMALTGNADSLYHIESDNRIHFMSYTATGSANPETFTAAYKPLTSEATTTDKVLTELGVADTITAFSTSTGILTTATASAAGNMYVLAYETNFVAV